MAVNDTTNSTLGEELAQLLLTDCAAVAITTLLEVDLSTKRTVVYIDLVIASFEEYLLQHGEGRATQMIYRTHAAGKLVSMLKVRSDNPKAFGYSKKSSAPRGMRGTFRLPKSGNTATFVLEPIGASSLHRSRVGFNWLDF